MALAFHNTANHIPMTKTSCYCLQMPSSLILNQTDVSTKTTRLALLNIQAIIMALAFFVQVQYGWLIWASWTEFSDDWMPLLLVYSENHTIMTVAWWNSIAYRAVLLRQKLSKAHLRRRPLSRKIVPFHARLIKFCFETVLKTYDPSWRVTFQLLGE